MSLRQRANREGSAAAANARAAEDDVYNIIPIHNLLAEHPALRFPEVRAAMAALRTVGDLRKPPFLRWHDGLDLLDWLGAFFGFQHDNVNNQREHLVLLLANAQMRLQPPPDNIDALEPSVVRRLRRKILHNYTAWCAYLGRKSNLWVSDSAALTRRASTVDPRRDLLYTALYLLIWGEAANLRFVPECLCYIFHHMAMDLNRILEDYIDDATGRPALPAISGENAFLTRVVTPVYKVIQAEVKASENGTASHAKWRNYDDINEYFWSRECFDRLKWPLDLSRNFFTEPPSKKRVRKTGFVEVRSFVHLFRSFDRLWIMLILYLQAAALVAWEGNTYPWQGLQHRDVQVKMMSVFITWAALRFVQAVLDIGTQHSLLRGETWWLGVRMVLKLIAAAAWTVAFSVLYVRVWDQRNHDLRWSNAADQRLNYMLVAAALFVLPEALAIALFIIPWIRNFLEKTNWRILYVLTWWFQTRTFVGRGLREGLVDNVKYALFWIVLLAVKFTFSYFLQIKPMVSPTKAIYNLRTVQTQWAEPFSHTNRFAVVILWIPVVLIYLMDIQIWYAIFSSLVGALVGLFSHLGEIRNVQQLRLRFQFFASAMQFNIMPEEQLLHDRGTLKSKFHEAILRLKLRYGLGRPYKTIELNQVAAHRFALSLTQSTPLKMAANQIRFGIIGCAYIAQKVSRAIALAPNAAVVAVGSRSVDKARRFIADNGLPAASVTAYGSYDAVLDDPAVDAVYVPLPTGLHVAWAAAAAAKGKHVLLEKPAALCVADLDRILAACEAAGVQFMDSTMWMHHPRTAEMKKLLSDPARFGELRTVNSVFTFATDPYFLENDIRVKPDLDGLGALGDIGWYCIRSILWAADYQLPNRITALRNPILNTAGVILACGASLIWDDGKVATFQCSFMAHLTMDLTAFGSKGALHVTDFVIPYEESSAEFTFCSDGQFNELLTGWKQQPSKHVVSIDQLPQEARMVTEFARLVGGIKGSGLKPEKKWPEITRKTQLVVDAVKASIEKGFEAVEIVS